MPQEPFLTLRDEANAIVAHAFRNTCLEELHAGRHSSLLDDPGNSRITDEEMKRLMLEACERMEKLLRLKAEEPEKYWETIFKTNRAYCRAWMRE